MHSTVDWCEQNYVQHPYIAEYYNTITGVSIMLASFIFKYTNLDLYNDRIYGKFAHHMNNIHYLYIIISVGTILFHGTLSYFYQLLDEIPLILITIEYSRLLYQLRKSYLNYEMDLLLTVFKFGYLVSLIIPFTYILGYNIQILTFHLTLKLFEGIVLFLLYNLSYIIKRNTQDVFLKEPELLLLYNNFNDNIKTYSYKGILIYTLSVTIWCLDKFMCNHVHDFYLHAMWHILSSLGSYYINNIIKYHLLLYSLIEEPIELINPPSTPDSETNSETNSESNSEIDSLIKLKNE